MAPTHLLDASRARPSSSTSSATTRESRPGGKSETEGPSLRAGRHTAGDHRRLAGVVGQRVRVLQLAQAHRLQTQQRLGAPSDVCAAASLEPRAPARSSTGRGRSARSPPPCAGCCPSLGWALSGKRLSRCSPCVPVAPESTSDSCARVPPSASTLRCTSSETASPRAGRWLCIGEETSATTATRSLRRRLMALEEDSLASSRRLE